jgi:putative PEP-CTERM system integral membrane protein
MKSPISAAGRSITKLSVGAFWCWNVIFICSTLPLLPSLPLLLTEYLFGDVPFDYVLVLLAWMAVPWACVILARTRLRGKPEALSFLFFAVEGPFFSLCLYRLIIMRELTPAVTQWLVLAAIGLCIYGYESMIRPLPGKPAWQALRLAAATGLVLVGLYVGMLVLITWTPLVLRGGWELIRPSNWLSVLDTVARNPGLFLALPISGVIVLFVGGSLVAMPLCLVALCVRTFVRAWRDRCLAPTLRGSVVLAMVILQAAIFAGLNRQPQQRAFELLSSPSLTSEQWQSNEKDVRAGLLNAYLAAYRYASSGPESNVVSSMYKDLLGLPKDVAVIPQTAFNTLAVPLLYDGENMQADARRAAELYERFFDTPIQRGERAAIANALSATYNEDERESGLINIDQRKVRVAEQRVRVEPKGDLARVTLDETYVNLTLEAQEIFYLFSLPESAAITGLWLGTSPDAMQPHTIASRGAAQKVYRAEVKRRIDPALLEQVGPRQYRLRAFPVPPKPASRAGDRPDGGGRLYLRLQYTTLAQNNAWPLPVLAEKRNVAWDRDTKRSCNGGECPGTPDTWWPKELPASKPIPPTLHAFAMDASGRAVIARPGTRPIPALTGRRVTLVVDQSWSMAAHREELLAALRQARRYMAGNTVSVLLATTEVMHTTPRVVPLADLSETMLNGFMGGGSVDRLLKQAAELIDEPQDLTVVITDNGAFDLDAAKTNTRIERGMLSMVHLGGALAPVYDDLTLETVQTSGGSSFMGLKNAWDHFALKQAAEPGVLMQRDGYVFSVEEDANPEQDPAFAPIAAHMYIASALRQPRPLKVEQMDALHALAGKHDVVTPYSSMLVLVNTEQQEALARAEADSDRFEREQESGTELLQKPGNPLSASMTPEPEEWLLLLVSLGILGWMIRLRRAACRRTPGPVGTRTAMC